MKKKTLTVLMINARLLFMRISLLMIDKLYLNLPKIWNSLLDQSVTITKIRKTDELLPLGFSVNNTLQLQ